MTELEDNDPIVRLAHQINRQCFDHDSATTIAALASVLGSTIDYTTLEIGSAPEDFYALRETLMKLVSDIVAVRASFLSQRES